MHPQKYLNISATEPPCPIVKDGTRLSRVSLYLLCGVLAVLSTLSILCGGNLHSEISHRTEIPVTHEHDFDWDKITPTRELNWVACYEERECTRLEVPLDYQDPTVDKAAIALLRVKANVSSQSTAYRGPVLFNPGGPGGSGVQFINKLGDKYQRLLGEEYDIIGFDPRGIGETTPKVSVFTDQWERAYWDSKAPPLINSTSGALPLSYARAKLFGELSEASSKRAAEHVSTAVVARDMLTITRAHGRDRLLYWGFSYGTVLGATYAAMYPNNIERLIIDGVVDFDDYYTGRWFANLHDTDKILKYFYDECFKAGPDDCPLYANSSALVQQRVANIFATIKAKPLPVLDGKQYDVIDYSTLKTALFSALYAPFPLLRVAAYALAGLEEGDGRQALAAIKVQKQKPKCNSPSGIVPLLRKEASLAVMCGEAEGVNNSIGDITRHFEELGKFSVFADVWTEMTRMGCTGWKVRASERFAGPFNSNTSFPLLIIGNTADPVTPLRGARKAAKYFNGSALLTVNTPGHCSEAGTSLCASKHIRRYFRTGELPEEGMVCEISDVLFGRKPVASQILNDEDLGLLEVAGDLAQSFHAARQSYLL